MGTRHYCKYCRSLWIQAGLEEINAPRLGNQRVHTTNEYEFLCGFG